MYGLSVCVLLVGEAVQACHFHSWYDHQAICHLATSRDEFFLGIDLLTSLP